MQHRNDEVNLSIMIIRVLRFLFPLLVIFSVGFAFYWLWNNYDKLPTKKEIVNTQIEKLKKIKPITLNKVLLKTAKTTFFVEIVKTPASRQKGLMFRENLPQDQGMFFVFDKTDIYNFWMPNVSFPLDIVWIDNDFKVVDIKTVPPCLEQNIQKCPSYIPDGKAKYVLEVNANAFDGVIGDTIEINLK